ncbi:MAG: glutamate-1-semialdehyde 2,1-aminomutase [Chloroflexi bacterium]|nr:glutamate-1-semialdehyde 2,1-aminomutase [Chloroflexota bacterium]
MKVDKSRQLFEEAKRLMPGGVSSPVRAFRAVGGQPLFIERAQGSRVVDVDGNQFVDYVCSWGPLILGHAPASIVQALKVAVERGTSYGASTELEITLAKMVAEAYPSIEMVRFVSSGTEATMSAIRLARAYTGVEKIVKFDGCYHGHGDSVLVKAGSGVLTLGAPDSPGVLNAAAQNTISIPYNDLKAAAEVFDLHRTEIAALVVEPVAGNMGVIPPKPGFLAALRKLCDENDALLIFDEVITGFRVALGGAQQLYNVKPDLTCLGKIIGGGLPVGAYGGRRDVMEMVAPIGPVYQAGTLSGNPLAMTAGIEMLRALRQPGVYEQLEARSQRLAEGLSRAAAEANVPVFMTRVGSMMTTFFTEEHVVDYCSAKTSDTGSYAEFFQSMLDNGVYLAPSQFEAAFVSLAHTEEDIDLTVDAARKAFGTIAKNESAR